MSILHVISGVIRPVIRQAIGGGGGIAPPIEIGLLVSQRRTIRLVDYSQTIVLLDDGLRRDTFVRLSNNSPGTQPMPVIQLPFSSQAEYGSRALVYNPYGATVRVNGSRFTAIKGQTSVTTTAQHFEIISGYLTGNNYSEFKLKEFI